MTERKSWPDVFMYKDYHTGELTALPPEGGKSYTVEVYDLDRYHELCRTGEVFGPEHRGPQAPIVDNRSAPKR